MTVFYCCSVWGSFAHHSINLSDIFQPLLGDRICAVVRRTGGPILFVLLWDINIFLKLRKVHFLSKCEEIWRNCDLFDLLYVL